MAMDEAQFESLLQDLAAETADLTATVASLSDAQWQLATPAEGWDVHDQVSHLAIFDEVAALGFSDPDAFAVTSATMLTTGSDWVDQANDTLHALAPAELIDRLENSRSSVLRIFREVGPGARTAWFGPPMSAASSATARLMETWAHGQDIYDAVGIAHPPSDRVRHVCHLGVITRRFAFALNGLPAPTEDVRVQLIAPSGAIWSWGAASSMSRVTGTAEDFALVVTQRRHPADTALLATPGVGQNWMSIAQTFAGAVGTRRAAGQFAPRQTAAK